MSSGEFPHLRDEDLPPEAVHVALGYVKGILYNQSDLQGDDAMQRTANNIARAVLQAVGWEPQPLRPAVKFAFDRCFVCGELMPDAESGEMCWGVPGRGVAHANCYSLEDSG